MGPQIDPAQIDEQLERILASSQFAATTRLNIFLRYIVEQALDGGGDRLKAYAIGVDVFERDEDFDPQDRHNCPCFRPAKLRPTP